jgi:lysophospholipase L1-like esterase
MSGEQARTNLAANLLLALSSLVVFALMLAGLEGALRVLGLGAPHPTTASRLTYQHVELPILIPGTRPDGTQILRTHDLRLPYQSVLRDKPADALRVAVLGGSATAGLGFSPNAAFARHLERMLERAHPERTIEVLNLGIVALSSEQVKLIVEDVCARFAPDAVVVYSGNNEFLELHAEKYARVHATAASRAVDLLGGSHLYRLVARATAGPPATPSLAGLSEEELRLSQREIVRDIETTPAEIDAIVDRYAANLAAMVESATSREVGILIATVASNWRWRGRDDLPDDWLDELAPGTAGDARYITALSALEVKLAASPARERYEWLYRRARIHEALGEGATARDEYRAAMNADPHLRRALDAMNGRVLALDAPTADVVAALADRAPGGIVGFDLLYDYVHFTPRGAVLVAATLFEALRRAGLMRPAPGFDSEVYVAEQLARLDDIASDLPEVREWLGFGFDPAGIADRDLWKYDLLLADLDERIERDPQDLEARLYRANARSFQQDGAEGAARDYRAVIDGDGPPAARANLEALLAERRP